MAKFETKDYNADAMQTLRDGVAVVYNYNAKLPDGTNNPQSKQQFAIEQIEKFLKRTAKEAKRKLRAAERAAQDSTDDVAMDAL